MESFYSNSYQIIRDAEADVVDVTDHMELTWKVPLTG